jgi:hypothetical protein
MISISCIIVGQIVAVSLLKYHASGVSTFYENSIRDAFFPVDDRKACMTDTPTKPLYIANTTVNNWVNDKFGESFVVLSVAAMWY